jgi:hypothetical protein
MSWCIELCTVADKPSRYRLKQILSKRAVHDMATEASTTVAVAPHAARFVFVRHGTTEWNKLGKWQVCWQCFVCDVPLSVFVFKIFYLLHDRCLNTGVVYAGHMLCLEGV